MKTLGANPVKADSNFHVRIIKNTGDGEAIDVAFAVPMGALNDATRADFETKLGLALGQLEGRMRGNNQRVLQVREEIAAQQLKAVEAEQRRQAAAAEANGGADPAGALHAATDS